MERLNLGFSYSAVRSASSFLLNFSSRVPFPNPNNGSGTIKRIGSPLFNGVFFESIEDVLSARFLHTFNAFVASLMVIPNEFAVLR